MTTNNQKSRQGIDITGVRLLDLMVHKLARACIMLVSYISKFPGFLLVVPAIVFSHKPELTAIPVPATLSLLLALYFYIISFYAFCCIGLYYISDLSGNPLLRERVCRYLDAPEVNYPDDFVEEKGRELAETGFTFKYLGDPRDHIVRVIVVPVTLVALSSTATRTLFWILFGW